MTAKANCRLDGRFAGSCIFMAAASCRSRSADRRWPLGSRVQEINSGASTYGHRFLTMSGRGGRAVKVKHFDDYRKRLGEHFVILDRNERHDRIARELDAEARRRGGRIARSLVGQGMLDEVPDLVEYPVVASGIVRRGIPAAARRSADDDDDSSSAFLPGRERPGEAAAGVSRRAQHGAGASGSDRAQHGARADGATA